MIKITKDRLASSRNGDDGWRKERRHLRCPGSRPTRGYINKGLKSSQAKKKKKREAGGPSRRGPISDGRGLGGFFSEFPCLSPVILYT